MLQSLKPHIFIDHATATFTFLINTNSSNGNYTINSTINEFDDPYQNGVRVYEFTLVSSSAPFIDEIKQTYPLPSSSSGNYNKISVRILIPNGSVVGSVTVNIKNEEHFTHDGTNVMPYCWIKSLPVPATKVFFKTYVPNTILPSQPTEIVLLPAKNKIVLNYIVPPLAANPNDLFSERSYNLSDYDPATYNLIEVRITEEDSSNNTRKKKGSGTTSQSDADSSDDN
ncbi:MAG: hypothetical protein KAX72_00180 [Chitinophagales bacterium]|jgi:hypothetical protein|nr:hypothetical protein [Bacteroidota bacterium]MBP8248484.1 hypothetical protein [Chitinophagales bacterium]